MKVGLLDVNMLIALAWPSHVHHHLARDWFARNEHHGWSSCPLTQCGFVRSSSNPKMIPDAVSPKEALALLATTMQHPHHHFWPDAVSLHDECMPARHLMGHRQVTDAYLLGLAIHHRGQLVTLDQGVENLLPHNSPHRKALCIVRAE